MHSVHMPSRRGRGVEPNPTPIRAENLFFEQNVWYLWRNNRLQGPMWSTIDHYAAGFVHCIIGAICALCFRSNFISRITSIFLVDSFGSIQVCVPSSDYFICFGNFIGLLFFAFNVVLLPIIWNWTTHETVSLCLFCSIYWAFFLSCRSAIIQ